MDTERYIENILGSENLTDSLDDNDASWLLDWGIGKLDEVLQGAADQETADRRAAALMAVMRKMNAITGSYAEKDALSLAQDLAVYQDLFAAAFPSTATRLAHPDFTEGAVRLSQLSTRQVLEYLSGDFIPPA
jgi:hypothetical protein